MYTGVDGRTEKMRKISEHKKALYAVAVLVAAFLVGYTAIMAAYESIELDLFAWQLFCALLLSGLAYVGIFIEETRAARRVHKSRYII